MCLNILKSNKIEQKYERIIIHWLLHTFIVYWELGASIFLKSVPYRSQNIGRNMKKKKHVTIHPCMRKYVYIGLTSDGCLSVNEKVHEFLCSLFRSTQPDLKSMQVALSINNSLYWKRNIWQKTKYIYKPKELSYLIDNKNNKSWLCNLSM